MAYVEGLDEVESFHNEHFYISAYPYPIIMLPHRGVIGDWTALAYCLLLDGDGTSIKFT